MAMMCAIHDPGLPADIGQLGGRVKRGARVDFMAGYPDVELRPRLAPSDRVEIAPYVRFTWNSFGSPILWPLGGLSLRVNVADRPCVAAALVLEAEAGAILWPGSAPEVIVEPVHAGFGLSFPTSKAGVFSWGLQARAGLLPPGADGGRTTWTVGGVSSLGYEAAVAPRVALGFFAEGGALGQIGWTCTGGDMCSSAIFPVLRAALVVRADTRRPPATPPPSVAPQE